MCYVFTWTAKLERPASNMRPPLLPEGQWTVLNVRQPISNSSYESNCSYQQLSQIFIVIKH